MAYKRDFLWNVLLNEHQLDRKLDAFTKTIFPNAKVKVLFLQNHLENLQLLSRPIKDLLGFSSSI